ncbi:MAG TPA: LysR family transcriptional regulator, partial [Novosphingobium sp.]|nr:LysR family transcriptional regulator [Novosphingobium sp.]
MGWTMRLGHFDMNLLLALDALLDTESVTLAAQRLNMGQSAMSSALGRLRDHFGDELLAKSGRSLDLTPFAISLKGPVQDALIAVRQAVTVRQPFDP